MSATYVITYENQWLGAGDGARSESLQPSEICYGLLIINILLRNFR